MTSSGQVELSVVLPVYFNDAVLEETMEGLRRELSEPFGEAGWEAIFVNDGSGDGSLDVLLELRRRDPMRVKVIALTRNFGQVNAIEAGLRHARGRYAVVMSADGQDPPSLIPRMIEAHEEGHDVVICARAGREESWYRRITSRFFYGLMRRLSFPAMPSGGFDFVSLSSKALQIFLSLEEAHSFFQGRILWMGIEPFVIPYRRRGVGGRSRWTFARKMTYLIDGVLSYSYLPLRAISFTGILVAFLGFLYALVILVMKLIGNVPIEGWAPLMIVVLCLSGIQMLMIGVLGEYLWRTLAQARGRPAYVIDRIYEGEEGVP